jgi:hypothetical protein
MAARKRPARLDGVARPARLRIRRASRLVIVLAARRRQNPQPGRLRHSCWAGDSNRTLDSAGPRPKHCAMRSEGLLKHLAICAVIAAVFYFTAYGWIEHRRTFKGPWEAVFRADAAGVPAILISQPRLGISETLVFPGQTVQPANLSRAIAFGQTPPDLPFGELLYQDPTFLPGSVVMSLFGHQVTLLPRALTVDKKEYQWQSGAVVEVR